MKDDLKVFENRSDDWLAKERAYEESISVWDFDEAKKIKKAHEVRHAAYNANHPKGVIVNNNGFVDFDSKQLRKVVITLVGISIVVFTLIMLLNFKVINEDFVIVIPFVMFIAISLLIPKKRRIR